MIQAQTLFFFNLPDSIAKDINVGKFIKYKKVFLLNNSNL